MSKRNSFKRHSLLLVFLAAAITPFSGVHAQTIEYLFFELRPLMQVQEGNISGPVALRAQAIFKQANFKTLLVPDLPLRRILTLLKQPVPNRCSAGWFKTSERLKEYQFTRPFYTDSRQIILSTKKNQAAIQSHQTLHSLMSDRALTMGAINGLSYGKFFDDLAVRLSTPRYLVQNPDQVYMMLASGRIDYVISDPLNITALPDPQRLKPEEFISTTFKDAPMGEQRHIICTQATSKATMDAIDNAILTINTGSIP